MPLRPGFKPFGRFLRYLKYRILHGFWPSECWNLDHEIAEWLLPRLKLFRQAAIGYPAFLHDHECTEAEWHAILDKIIVGLEIKLTEWDEVVFTTEQSEKVAIAFDLLGKHAQDLWD